MRFAGSMGRAASAAAAVFAILVMSASSPAEPAGEPKTSASIQAGDVAITGFSGTSLASDKLAPGVDPVDRTFIDPSGPALRVFDVSNLGGAPAGKLVAAPLRLDVPARQIGQVFGMALDDGTAGGPPNLYVAATSAFGLNIVGADRAADGKPVRLKAGAPDATFMEGQFGALSDGSPGAIYKIDGATGSISSIADTAFSGKPNSGAGVGGLAFDPASRSLYASDLDSGVIHRFGLDYNNADLDQYDHGVAGRSAKGLDQVPDDGRRLQLTEPSFKADDPSTWGFTQPARRIDALAVHDGRLYYAVAEGPEIWSVGLNGGAFLDDARLEVAIKAEKPYPVTGIAFDSSGRMLVAQRGPVKSPYDYGSFSDTGAQVLRYEPEAPDDPATPDLWKSVPATYAIGTADHSNAGSGGVSLQYGYKPDGTIDLNTCDATVAATGDTLTAAASGVQLNSLELVRPANVPPNESAFIDYDEHQEDPNVRGHVGSVAAVRICGAAAGFPPVEAGEPGAPGAFPPVEEGGGAAGGGGEAFPPVEEGGGGQTVPEEGGGGTTTNGQLTMTKLPASTTCAENQTCAFKITVKNESDKPVDKVVIRDDPSIGGVPFTKFKLGEVTAPWECVASAGPGMECKHPPLQPNESAELTLGFTPDPGSLAGAAEFNNCASLAGENGAAANNAQPQQALPPPSATNDGGLKVETLGTSPSCSPATGNCEFEIKITNNTGQPITNQPLKLFNTLSVGTQTQAKNNVTSMQLPPGLACKPEGRELNCSQDQLTLAPNQSVSLKVAFSVDTTEGGEANFVRNKTNVTLGPLTGEATAAVGILDNNKLPEPGAEGQQAAGAGQPAAPACATLPVEPPEQPQASEAGQVSLVKTGISCKDNRLCTFNFAISNTSATDFDGTVEFNDSITGDGATFGATAITPAPPAPWSCPKDGQGFKCSAKLKITANSAAPPLSLTFDLGPGIGAVQTAENCATLKDAPTPSCAKLPMQAAGPVNADGKPALSITKTGPAECSDLAGCDFTIAIKNDGDAPFNGPVNVDEEVTLDGKSLPGTIIVPNQTWKCTPGGTSTCTSIPEMIIGPKGTATLRVHVIFTALTGAKAMQNCASVPGQPAKACASVPLIQGPKLVITKERVDGVCDPICTFRITIKNIGNGKFPGPIQIVDFPGNITSNSGQTDIKAEVVSAKLIGSLAQVTCKKSGNIWCDINTGLEPGISETIELTMAVGINDFAGDNCVLRRDLPAGTEPPVCVAMLGLRHQGPNLLVEKRNASPTQKGADHCELKKECLFIIRVTNNGTSDYTGPIKVTDTISLGVPELLEEGPGGNLGWNCTKAGAGGLGAPSIDCTIPGAPNPLKPGTFVPLAPGKFIELGISVKPGSTWKNSNTIKNCAELIDIGQDMGPITGAKNSCTTQKLDPFKLKIEKTGDQSCQPGGECKFDLNIFNDQQIVHDDPVTVVDNLTGISSAEIVSITPVADAQPFPCKPQPTQVPFNCTGHMKLKPGDKNHYTIVIRLPADASATSFSNCASVGGSGEPVPRSEGGPGPAGQQSCHEVKLAPPVQPPEKRECKGGMILLDEGACACPPGTMWNGRRCDEGVKECPRSLPVGTFPNCCERDHHFDPSVNRPRGGCVSDTGRGGTNDTKGDDQPPPRCEGDRPVGTFPNCCPSGTHFADGACHGNVGPTPPPACTGRRPVGTFPNCCPADMHFERGACRRDEPRGGTNGTQPGGDDECPRSAPVGTPPHCCPRNNHFERGACRPDVARPPPRCEGDRPVGTFPNCCPINTHFARGACRRDGGNNDNPNGGTNGTAQQPVCEGKRPVGTFPNCCPLGMHFQRGACRRDGGNDGKPDGGAIGTQPGGDNGPGRKCPAGTIGRFPRCKCPLGMSGSPPNCCPPGTRFENGKCVRPKPTGPGNGGASGTKQCPPGTHSTRSGQCVQDAAPKQKPTPTPTPPPPPKCPSNTPFGSPPNCCGANDWNPTTHRCEKFQGPK